MGVEQSGVYRRTEKENDPSVDNTNVMILEENMGYLTLVIRAVEGEDCSPDQVQSVYDLLNLPEQEMSDEERRELVLRALRMKVDTLKNVLQGVYHPL